MGYSNMDLMKPVQLCGKPCDIGKFRAHLVDEQQSALAHVALDPHPGWHVPTAASDKVHPDGHFKPYFGDTVVVPLQADAIGKLSQIQAVLREAVGDQLADPIQTATYHVTLHDLTSSAEQASLGDALGGNRQKVERLFDRLADVFASEPALGRVRLTATHIFPCMNISILAGAVPVTERDFRILMNVHALFDEIVALDYWLRPHVTLAYFKPRPLQRAAIQRLAHVLAHVNPPALDIDLDLRALAYQCFTDMNSYESVRRVGSKQSLREAHSGYGG